MIKKLGTMCFILLLASQAYANSIGEISMLRGKALIVRNNANLDASIQMAINEKDRIKTQGDSKLQLTFADKTVITLGENTSFSVEDYLYDEKKPSAKFSVQGGSFKVITGKIGKLAPKSFLLKTKTSLIGIRGTIFSGEVGTKNAKNQGDHIACLKGTIEVASLKTGSSQTVEHGQMIFVNTDGNLGEVKKLDEKNFTTLSYQQKTKSKKTKNSKVSSNDRSKVKDSSLSNNADNSINEPSNPSDLTAINTNENQIAKPDIDSLIANDVTVSYSGKLDGESKGEHISTNTSGQTTTTQYKADIKADMEVDIDFGGNNPMNVKISNQDVSIKKININDRELSGDDFNQAKQVLDSSDNDLQSSMQMEQKLNSDELSITGSYEKTANGLTQKANLQGKFGDKNVETLTGTLKESTKGTVNGVKIDRKIDSDFNLKQN